MLEAGIQDYPQTSLALSLARMNALLDRADDAEAAFALARHQLDASGQVPLRAISDLEHAAWLSERSAPTTRAPPRWLWLHGMNSSDCNCHSCAIAPPQCRKRSIGKPDRLPIPLV